MIQNAQRVLKQLGPGLITGAADDDPSGIATYSQAGAQFGYALGWTVVLTYPLMVGIQLISARMGRVTGHGLAENIRRHFPRPLPRRPGLQPTAPGHPRQLDRADAARECVV